MAYHFRGKPLPEKAGKGYVNLETGRSITDMHKKGFKYLDLATLQGATGGPFICAEESAYLEFLRENSIPLPEAPILTPPGAAAAAQPPGGPAPRTPPMVQLGSSAPSAPVKLLFRSHPSMLPPPPPVVNPFTCFSAPSTPERTRPAAEPLPPPPLPVLNRSGVPRSPSPSDRNPSLRLPVRSNAPDVDSLSEAEIGSLGLFHLSGLHGKARILRVLDGDTVELLLYVPLSTLTSRIERRGRSLEKLCAASVPAECGAAGFYARFLCRLVGIDFAEHTTLAGILGLRAMHYLYAQLRHRVYYRSGKFDKYGRLLVELFSDSECTQSINTHYAGQMIPGVGHFVEVYGGRTKSDYMRNLPPATPEQIAEYAQLDVISLLCPLRTPMEEKGKGVSSFISKVELEVAEIDQEHGSVPHWDLD